jgi:hypothetical protein
MPTKFDFVSPGIELREIDQSQVAPVPEADGLLLIGRSRKGPAMKPVKVNSLENFIEVFGTPMDGVKASDPWRQGNTGAASYAGYAAQAYLASGVGPVKFIRLGGLHNDTEKAGWGKSSKLLQLEWLLLIIQALRSLCCSFWCWCRNNRYACCCILL